MTMSPFAVAASLLLVGAATSASAAQPGTLEVRRGGTVLRVDAIAADIVRVRIAPGGALAEDASWSVSAALRAARAAAQDVSDAATAGLRTSALTVRVDRASLAIRIEDATGGPILADAPGAPFAFDGARFTLRKARPPGERYFALGDKTGPLDRGGRSFVNWNTDTGVTETVDPIYKSIPFMVAAGGPGGSWGLLLDDSWRSSFDLGHRDAGVLELGADGGAVDYYVIVGGAGGVKPVVERYADLTGHPAMPPKWALGYQQSRYSYMTAQEARDVVARFRKDRFPLDVLWMDIDYQDRNRPFTVDSKTFPDFPGLVADLRAQGVSLVTITDLHVAKTPGDLGYAPYASGLKADAFVRAADGSVFSGEVWPGPAVFPDFTSASARSWWGGLYSGFARDGVAGFWNDMNEPSVFSTPTKTIPLDARQKIETPGFTPRIATHEEVHNLTGLLNTQATYEGVLRLKPDSRPFVMTRSTFAGGQKWAVTWTGDNESTWSQLKLGVAQTLNLGLSGFAFTAVDVPGFGGAPTPELATKWFEVQAFLPLFRGHSAKGTPRKEPWVDGPAQETIRRRYVEERYRLMPYLYGLAEEAHRTGAPIARPVFYDDPSALDAPCDTSMTWMLGLDLLIAAPPQPEAPVPYRVCLPKGRWVDYWTGAKPKTERYDNRPFQPAVVRDVVTETPSLERLPVYVRAGAIIPKQPLTQSLSQTPQGPLELHVWPGADCGGTLYDDDGTSRAFERGVFLRQAFRCEAAGGAVTVSALAREGRYAPWWREMRVVVHGWAATRAKVVGGGPATVDAAEHTASFTVPDTKAVAAWRLTPG